MTNNDQFNFVIERVERLENHLEKFIEENTKRLDTLIEITRHMSAINERQLRHSDDISELKGRLNNFETNTSSSLSRTHSRIDEIVKLNDVLKNEIKESIDTKIVLCDSKNTATKEKFDKWFNRLIGAWAIMVLVFGLMQWGLDNVVDVVKDKLESHSQMINDHTMKIQELELRRGQ